MNKNLFATISVAQENQKRDVKIYKLLNEKYGIEVVEEENGESKIKRVENLTNDEQKINKLLEILVLSAQNFTLLEDFAYDTFSIFLGSFSTNIEQIVNNETKNRQNRIL